MEANLMWINHNKARVDFLSTRQDVVRQERGKDLVGLLFKFR